MAALFVVSMRTINRWETGFGITAERKNARVLRYGLDCVIGLVALGLTLDNTVAERLGLNPRAIIALASAIASGPRSLQAVPVVQNVVLVAEGDEDRSLIAAWRDATLGPVLRKILRGLTEQSPATA